LQFSGAGYIQPPLLGVGLLRGSSRDVRGARGGGRNARKQEGGPCQGRAGRARPFRAYGPPPRRTRMRGRCLSGCRPAVTPPPRLDHLRGCLRRPGNAYFRNTGRLSACRLRRRHAPRRGRAGGRSRRYCLGGSRGVPRYLLWQRRPCHKDCPPPGFGRAACGRCLHAWGRDGTEGHEAVKAASTSFKFLNWKGPGRGCCGGLSVTPPPRLLRVAVTDQDGRVLRGTRIGGGGAGGISRGAGCRLLRFGMPNREDPFRLCASGSVFFLRCFRCPSGRRGDIPVRQ